MNLGGLDRDIDEPSLVRHLREAVADDLRVVALFDADDYRLLHVADRVLDQHGGETAFRSQSDQLHSYINLDFIEQRLFTELFPGLGSVTALTTRLDQGLVIRYYLGERGILVATDGTVPGTAVIEAIETALEG